MPDHDLIYKKEAEKYDALISKQPSLRDCMNGIRPISGLDIVDLGAGTGRLTAVLAPEARSIVALDAQEAMLSITAARLSEAGLTNWSTKVADHRQPLPLNDQSADLIVAGWTICYVGTSDNPAWEHDLEVIMTEMRRVLRNSGTIIIFETLGTGYDKPTPPPFLRPYYAALVEKYGFSHQWIRTDYQFESAEQAEQLTRFFFSDKLADRVAEEGTVKLPECAGVWWLHAEEANEVLKK